MREASNLLKIPGVVVEIDQSMLQAITRRFCSYVALFDPELEDVLWHTGAKCETFIFMFLTISSSLNINWQDLPKSNYIVGPIWLGDIEPDQVESAARQIIERALRPQ